MARPPVTLRYEGDTPGSVSGRQAAVAAPRQRGGRPVPTLRRPRARTRGVHSAAGIDRETAEAFGVGYAPRYPDFLLRRLARSLSTEILVEAGLAIRDSQGEVRDRFRGRITFPVHDLAGRAVGIGARILPQDRPGERSAEPQEGPKYLNSPETPVYRKADVLYNLNRAKAAISRSGEVYVVEGYTDVIAMAQGGIETAVATCGTALGEGHFRLASRFAQRMVLAFDSDEAGARAAERAFQFLEAYPVRPVVLILPEGQDADFVGRAAGTPCGSSRPGRCRWSSTCSGGRSTGTTCPPSRGRARPSPPGCRCSSSSATRFANPSTRTCSRSSSAWPRPQS
jgi:DNA primase